MRFGAKDWEAGSLLQSRIGMDGRFIEFEAGRSESSGRNPSFRGQSGALKAFGSRGRTRVRRTAIACFSSYRFSRQASHASLRWSPVPGAGQRADRRARGRARGPSLLLVGSTLDGSSLDTESYGATAAPPSFSHLCTSKSRSSNNSSRIKDLSPYEPGKAFRRCWSKPRGSSASPSAFCGRFPESRPPGSCFRPRSPERS